MRRVVLDTNVLVSALLTPAGIPASIFEIFKTGQIDLYYNAEIMEEYEDVLLRQKFSFAVQKVYQVLEKITKAGVLIIPQRSTILLLDETDRRFYDTAKTCSAFLVTGNIRHYPTEEFVVTPKQFLEREFLWV